MPDLTGVRAKLRRADEHRQAYDDLFARFLETQPYSILFEFDPESGWHVFRWLVTSEPPLEPSPSCALLRARVAAAWRLPAAGSASRLASRGGRDRLLERSGVPSRGRPRPCVDGRAARRPSSGARVGRELAFSGTWERRLASQGGGLLAFGLLA